MPFKASYKKDFYISQNKIYLNEIYKIKNQSKFKKITGTRLAAILDKNKYTSPFKTWAIMTNIFYEKMDETLSRVGNLIEPKIKKFVEEKLKINYLSYNPQEINWDAFSKIKVFGGIPDGEPVNERNDFLYKNGYPMLEIKTSSINGFEYKMIDNVLTMQKDKEGFPIVKDPNKKYLSWFTNNEFTIPEEYKLQLGLYLYLRKIDIGMFAVAFLQDEDYVYPENFDAKKREIRFSMLYIDRQEFDKIVSYAQKWYDDHIVSGISPMATEEDLKWLQKELNL